MNTMNVYHNLIIIQSIGSVDACLSFFFFFSPGQHAMGCSGG